MAQPKSEAPDPIYQEIGRLIRQFRTRSEGPKITQQELAKAISVTRSSIANMELGRQKMMAHTLIEIAEMLQVTPAELLPDDLNRKREDASLPGDLSEGAREWIETVRAKATS